MFDICIYIFIGISSGLIAGLFGVGGGTIIVPMLIILFSQQELTNSTIIHMALATSLSIIFINAMFSTNSHYKNKNISWLYVKILSPGLVLGVMIGVFVTKKINNHILQYFMGIFLILIALKTKNNFNFKKYYKKPNIIFISTITIITGCISAFFGIGGGSIIVPYINMYGVNVKKSIGTAAACSIPIAFFGTLSNIVIYNEQNNIIKHNIGFIYLPAFFIISIFGIPFAKYGANLTKKIKTNKLHKLFNIFLIITGIIITIKNYSYIN